MIKSETLMDYIEGRLSGRERAAVEVHLSQCERCLDEFVILKNMQSSPELESSIAVSPALVSRTLEHIRHLRIKPQPSRSSELFTRFQRSLRGLVQWFQVWQGGEFSPVRGGQKFIDKDLALLKRSFEELDVTIEIDRKGKDSASVRIALDNPDETTRGVRVSLYKDDREVSSDLIGSDAALFEEIPFGRYELLFTSGGREKGVLQIEIKESNHDR